MGDKTENKDMIIDWSKFKSNAKRHNLQKAKNGYVEFCEMLNEVDFELVSDYISSVEKVELKYKLRDLRLNIKLGNFKTQTYNRIINFKENLIENGDKFIDFIKLSRGNSLIANIKTFDGGNISIDITSFNSFNKSRQDFYNKLKEVNGRTDDYYIRKETKMNIYIDDVKLNPMSSDVFKQSTYKSIINFKKKLEKKGDGFIKFAGLTSDGNLIAKIKTFDNGEINIDISQYDSFNKSRKDTYDYCEKKNYKILSPYISATDKMLIDFNCGHDAHWTKPPVLKCGHGCPACSISKGEKVIRLYLENNNIEFIQEYRFDDCRYKKPLPFDFYMPDYNLCIEFDGEQHYKAFDYFGGEKYFKLTQTRDKIKNKFCKDNNVNLLRIPYYEIDNVNRILDKEFDRFKK